MKEVGIQYQEMTACQQRSWRKIIFKKMQELEKDSSLQTFSEKRGLYTLQDFVEVLLYLSAWYNSWYVMITLRQPEKF